MRALGVALFLPAIVLAFLAVALLAAIWLAGGG
jgi:hypothetical protein